MKTGGVVQGLGVITMVKKGGSGERKTFNEGSVLWIFLGFASAILLSVLLSCFVSPLYPIAPARSFVDVCCCRVRLSKAIIIV